LHRRFGHGLLVQQQLGRDQRAHRANARVVGAGAVENGTKAADLVFVPRVVERDHVRRPLR